MKKLFLALAGASVAMAAPAVAAPNFGHNGYNQHQQVQKRKNVRVVKRVVNARNVRQAQRIQARQWQRGQRFDQRYAYNYRVIQNPRAYNLYNAPRGYRWVQSNNDAVLVAITSGIIGAIIGNAL
jgi:Ni/Co efflux regulator RcnB